MTSPAAVPLNLHPGPGAGFDAPFEMLAACHERVARMLRLLARLADHLRDHGADRAAADAARDVMRYFDQAAPHHHEDEERHVLPALREAGRTDLADRLHADHERMAAAWQALRSRLRAVERGEWPAEGAGAAGEFAAAAAGFAALYHEHVELEDREAFPQAAARRDDAARAAMGAEMAARRGLR